MLASITPLGERGRQSNWVVTMIAFVLGAVGAGAALGAILGWAGGLVLGGVGTQSRLMALAAAALLTLALELSPTRVPGPRRQVNERWLDEYRGWVYGLGFGAQLGIGVTTIVSSAATYLALFAAFLAGGPGRGAVIAGVFGLARGLTPLAGARVHRPEQLIALHGTLARLHGAGAVLGQVMVAAVFALAVAGGLS